MDPIKYFYLRVIATNTSTLNPKIEATEMKIELFYFEMMRMLTEEYAIEGMRQIVNRLRIMRHVSLVDKLMDIARALSTDGRSFKLHQGQPIIILDMTIDNNVISKLVSEFDPDYVGIVNEDEDEFDADDANEDEDAKEEEEKKE